jgi:hypothetical protein
MGVMSGYKRFSFYELKFRANLPVIGGAIGRGRILIYKVVSRHPLNLAWPQLGRVSGILRVPSAFFSRNGSE